MNPHSELAAALQMDLANSSAVWSSDNPRLIEYLRQHIRLAHMIAEAHGRGGWTVPPDRGDEVRQCFSSADDAAECALALIAHFSHEAQAALGLPRMPPRVALHWGRVNPRGTPADGDAFLAVSAIEPAVNPGEAWATEDFASVLLGNDRSSLQPRYIGTHTFPKIATGLRLFRIMPGDQARAKSSSGRRDPVDIAIDILDSGTDLEQEDAILALGGLRSARSTEALLRAASDVSRSSGQRHAALKALAQLADPDSSARLRALLNATVDAPSRRLLVHAIGAIKDSDNAGELISIAESSGEPLEVRETALLGLYGSLPGRSVSRIQVALAALLSSPIIDLVRAAAVAASSVGVPQTELRDRLAACVTTVSLPSDVRQAALESLIPSAPLARAVTDIAIDTSQPDPLRRLVLDYLLQSGGPNALRLLNDVSENTVDPLRTYALLGLSQMHSVAVRPNLDLSRLKSESAHARILRLRLPA